MRDIFKKSMFSFGSLIASFTQLCPVALAQGAGAGASSSSVRPMVQSKPVQLDWRSIKWPTLNYSVRPIDGGASLLMLPSPSAKKFKVELVFPTGVYTHNRSARTTLGAAVDMLLLGGAGNRSYEQLQNYLSEEGLSIGTRLLGNGHVEVVLESLTADSQKAFAVLDDLLFKPKFAESAFSVWKQEEIDDFNSSLDASSLRKQGRFIEQEAIKLSLGENHYFSTFLKRNSKKEIEKVSFKDMKTVGENLFLRSGLKVFLSGTYSDGDVSTLEKILLRLPRRSPVVYSWLPERVTVKPSKKLRIAIIKKPDMSQSSLTYRVGFSNLGTLNPFEEVRFRILKEVYSSSGGVVGNDRFSKALRADSGISYSPNSSFGTDLVDPNTNVAQWRMDFQSPNERIVEAVQLAKKTWTTFVSKGITAEELQNTKIALMNSALAQERTVFDYAQELKSSVLENEWPSSIRTEEVLANIERESNLSEFNALLSGLSQSQNLSLVIMGNPDAKTIQALKKIPDVEIVKTVDFSSIVAELTAP